MRSDNRRAERETSHSEDGETAGDTYLVAGDGVQKGRDTSEESVDPPSVDQPRLRGASSITVIVGTARWIRVSADG